MRRILTITCVLLTTFGISNAQTKPAPGRTICNPLNLSYRYMPDEPSRREAADPTIILFHDDYYLFASKSGGYWWSNDLIDWHLIETHRIPTEDYAPTAVAVGDTIFFLASSSTKCTIYKSADPKSGRWDIAKDSLPFTLTDPALFLDGDNRLYLYWGCSPTEPIHGVELERTTLDPIGLPKNFILADTKKHGWEKPGDENELEQAPWIEGPAMNKFGGRYYLQYAAPGTEYFSYADGVYVSDDPLGPFSYAPINPFSYKPGGYIRGAGHGSTFTDRYDNVWHVATMTISVLHKFERRIGLFPASVDSKGDLVADAGCTDGPITIPQSKISHAGEVTTGWMVLSYGKTTVASSSLEEFPASNAVDENIRTSWCARSGNAGEWLKIDLEKPCTVRALQINFTDHETGRYTRDTGCAYGYIIEYSVDEKSWTTLIDKSASRPDSPHDYVQLPEAVMARYVRLVNDHIPGGLLSISDLRVFGTGPGRKPGRVSSFTVVRDTDNRCIAHLSWKQAPGATGYTVRFGPDSSSLSYRYPVYGDTRLTLRSLNANERYYFSVESFNENGTSESRRIQSVR